MKPESTRCPIMTKDPVRPALCWREFCELYDDEAGCCSIRLIAIRLGQIYGEMTSAAAPRTVGTVKPDISSDDSSDDEFKIVK